MLFQTEQERRWAIEDLARNRHPIMALKPTLTQIEMIPRWIALTTAVMRLLTPSFLIVFER